MAVVVVVVAIGWWFYFIYLLLLFFLFRWWWLVVASHGCGCEFAWIEKKVVGLLQKRERHGLEERERNILGELKKKKIKMRW